MKKRIEFLELLFDTLPFLFWKDQQGKYQGTNLNQIHNLGFSASDEFIGKTVFEILKDPHSAKIIDEVDNKVMNENKTIITEEKITVPVGERTYLSQKSPIHNKEGKVVGMLGLSMDITELKKAEETVKKERARLMELAQVAHDIRSPLASMQILLKSCQDIPEKERIALREATMRIQDIANNLLTHYSQKDIDNAMSAIEQQREPILVSALLSSLLSEKKLQYQDSEVKFIDEFSQKGNFAFIQVQASAFNRMISNLINNAVEALDNKAGNVTLKLEADTQHVRVVIADDGKGMQPELVEKIRNNIAVTEGKEQGHGLGWTQVRETLQCNHGEFSIESQYGSGTKITLTFPRIKAPAWIAENVKLKADDILVILDDDQSIHCAWNSRFEPLLTQNPDIRVSHFTKGEEALSFIEALTPQEKQRVFLLSDYELLKQNLTGLDVIEQSGVKNAILVTSHYASQSVRERAAETGTKILPKSLASEIPIILIKADEERFSRPVEIVLIDDDDMLLYALKSHFKSANRVVETFQNPYDFLSRLDDFPKTVKICFDHDFKLPDINGFTLAKTLHEQGYTKLYMFSGTEFEKSEVPSYLTLAPKSRVMDSLKLI